MASHRLTDDVPYDVKLRRHVELVDAFRDCAEELNQSLIGKCQVVLIEGVCREIHFSNVKILKCICFNFVLNKMFERRLCLTSVPVGEVIFQIGNCTILKSLRITSFQ